MIESVISEASADQPANYTVCGICSLRILPVIDIKDGIAVRGVAGERDRYRPVESGLTTSHAVIDVAESLRDHFRLDEFYIADLDAILADRPHFDLYEQLAHRGFRLLVDAGLRDVSRAAQLIAGEAAAVIAGLETAPGPAFIAELCAVIGPERVIFSLDLRNGIPMTISDSWDSDPVGIAGQAVEAGVRRMIVLDLAAVGGGGGFTTLELCQTIRKRFPETELITGGGVRNIADLRTLHAAGLNGVLIASALHTGAITPADIAELA